jgi:Xaa-Pro dipeptidase
MIKSPAELALLRRANVATKAAIARVAPEIAPGMRESEIAAKIRAAQRAAGLVDIWALALVGANAAFPHGTDNERVLDPGDAVLVDTGGSLHGYRSDISRTWFVGDPPAEVCDAWAIVLEAQARALAGMRPGIPCGSIDALARATIDAAGHGPGYRRFTHRLGHGIGLEVHEDPYLVGGAETLLAPGMVMSNEPGIYVPDAWGIRIEDIAVITEDGAEVFGPRPRSITDPFGEEA